MAKKNNNIFIIVLAGAVILFGVYTGIKQLSPQKNSSSVSQTDVRPFTNAEIEGFVSHDFPKVLTFDAGTDLATHMSNIKPYLTPEGAEGVEEAFRQSRWLESGLSSDVHFTQPPRVVETRGKGASQEWRVDAVLEQDSTGNGKTIKNNMKLKLLVMPKDDPNNYLGIRQMILIPQ